MDDAEYHRICARPDVMPRWVLEETLAVLERLDSPHSRLVRSALRGAAVAKPQKHRGGAGTDFFRVAASDEEAVAIAEALFSEEGAAVEAKDPSGLGPSRLGELADTWNRLHFLLSEGVSV